MFLESFLNLTVAVEEIFSMCEFFSKNVDFSLSRHYRATTSQF